MKLTLLLLTSLLLGCGSSKELATWDEPMTTPEIELMRGRWRPFMDEAVRKTGEQLDPTKRWVVTDSSKRSVPTRTNECDYEKQFSDTGYFVSSPEDWYGPIVTLQDLESYLKECWDDSTLEEKTFYITVSGVDYGFNGDSVQIFSKPSTPFTKLIFSHREPTLQGFSDYLKGKK